MSVSFEIIDSKKDKGIEKNELDRNAMGGTELMKYALYDKLPKELLDKFQICTSIPGKIPLDKNKINIQPISICYSKLNNIPMGIYLRRNIAWVGDTSMVAAMANFLRSGRITVDIIFHEIMSINNFENRKDLALYCEKKILNGINQKLKVN